MAVILNQFSNNLSLTYVIFIESDAVHKLADTRKKKYSQKKKNLVFLSNW